jgi:hypothetical protein
MADADSTCLTSRCSVCRETKPAAEFNRATHHKNGLSSRCKACNADYCARYKASGGVRKSHAQRSAERAMAPDRLCPMCMATKPKDQFGRCASRKDGLRVWCKQCHNAANKAWRANSPEKAASAVKAWEMRNPDRVKAKRDKSNARMWAMPSHRLRIRIGSALRNALGTSKGWRPSVEIVGYTIDELRRHLERQFLPGMGWHNMCEWHIDHIVPLSSFTIEGPDDPEVKRAWALSNLRPCWAMDNRIKKDKRLFLL